MMTTTSPADRTVRRTLAWLSEEFPEWSFSLETTVGWNRVPRDLWVARRPGHHEQSALTAGKLVSRLEEHDARETHRRPATTARP